MNLLAKLGYWLLILVVILIAGLLLISLLPIAGNYQVKIVQSGSMEPAIKTGSIVVIKPQENYRVGDIITFGEDTREKVPISHRIVADRVQSGTIYYTTKGDANEDVDQQEVPKSEVIGQVIFSVPYVGYVIDAAKQPVGFMALVGLPALIIVGDEIAKIIKELRNMRHRRRLEE